MAFGARVPGSDEHAACGDWLVRKLAQFGAQVHNQYGTMTNYAGESQALRNIVAYFEGTTPNTILLCAHIGIRALGAMRKSTMMIVLPLCLVPMMVQVVWA